MNVRSCKKCGRLFNYITGAPMCPACREAMEEKFQVVKAYIREHKGAGITEVSEACDVDAAQIRQWLREDRLEVTQDSALFLNCESCGTAIRSGRYCEKCLATMTQGFHNAMNATRQSMVKAEDKNNGQGAKMRFLKN